jgi:hypothetical protein
LEITDNTKRILTPRAKIKKRVEYDYKICDKVLVIQDGILRKAQSPYSKEPWTITTVHTNGTIGIQRGTKLERLNIRRVTPYTHKTSNLGIRHKTYSSPTLNNLMLFDRNLSLHLSRDIPIKLVIFFTLTDKVFFPLDGTLIASFVGASVIGHGLVLLLSGAVR